MTTTTSTPPTRVVPDVWQEPAIGLEWCDCGNDCPLTEEIVAQAVRRILGGMPERMTHRQVIAVAMEVWKYGSVCRFFTLAIEDAATRIHGQVAPDYPTATGMAIVKDFSNRWSGCPTEGCEGGWTPEDVGYPD